jgi:hypothetical protein
MAKKRNDDTNHAEEIFVYGGGKKSTEKKINRIYYIYKSETAKERTKYIEPKCGTNHSTAVRTKLTVSCVEHFSHHGI